MQLHQVQISLISKCYHSPLTVSNRQFENFVIRISKMMELVGFSGKTRVSSKQWENIYLLRDFVCNVLYTLFGQKKKRGVA